MALTRRAGVVALIGVLVVFFVPLGGLMVAIVEAALAVGIVVDLVLAGSVRALKVSRYGDTSCRLGDTATVGVVVANRGSRPVRGLLRDAWPPSAGERPSRQRVDIPPGERRRLTTTLRPARRTQFDAARVTVRSVGPLGLAARQGNHEAPWSLRVLPPFVSRKHLPEKLAHLRLLDGRTAARVRGQGTEFDSLRDYVEGDDARSIDWRATARRSNIVVRTWRPERDRQLVLVLDTGRTSATRVGGGTSVDGETLEGTRLDAAIDAALLLGALAAKAGDRVDVIAVDDRSRLLSRAASAGDSLAALVRSVADVHPRLVETNARQLAAEVLRRAPRRALVVLFTTLDEAAISEGLLATLPALTARHTVMLASVTDPSVLAMAGDIGDTRRVYDAAAAEKTLATAHRMSRLLRRLGVDVVEGPPEEFASKVADAYLSLKAAGRL